jgi:hypothetical protein
MWLSHLISWRQPKVFRVDRLDDPVYNSPTELCAGLLGYTRSAMMRFIALSSVFLCLVIAFASIGLADSPASKADIEKALTSQYTLTKATDDKSDIVTAGAVLVLQKDKLIMVTSDAQVNHCLNTYKDGKLNQNGACKANETLKKIPLFGHAIPGQDKVANTRTFVSGEKFWVTKIEVKDAGKDQGVVMEFFSDPIKDVRYKGTLTILFAKGLPSADDALKLVGEVVTVAPSEDAKADDKQQEGAQGQQQAPQQPQQAGPGAGTPDAQAPAQAAPAAAEAPPAEIAPPPPPADTPPAEVSIGQTPEQVVAALGEPTKKAKIGTKEIYYYKDMKVIFVNGKVKDVQ